MKTKIIRKIIAILACIFVYMIYIFISGMAGWKHGGGVIVLCILIAIMRYIWKKINNVEEQKNKNDVPPIYTENKNKEEEKEQITSNQDVILTPIDNTTTKLESNLPPIIEEVKETQLPPIPQENNTYDAKDETIENNKLNTHKTTNNTNEEINKNNKQKTHWQKFKVYYIIGLILCFIISIVTPMTIAYKQKQAEQNKKQQIEDLIQKADDAYENSFYDLAIKYLNEAEKIDPNHLAINYYLGRLNVILDNYSSAVKYLQKAYELNPQKQSFITYKTDTIGFDKLLYWYSIALENNYYSKEQSIAITQEYLSLYPDDANAYRCLIFAYYENKEVIKAKQWVDKMIEKFPNNNDSYFVLAYILSEMENYNGAIKNYKKSIELEPQNSLSHNNLGCCYEQIGEYQKAYYHWRKAIELGDDKYAHSNLKRHGQSY